MHDKLVKLLDEVKQLLMATDRLKAFTDWPDDKIAGNSAILKLVLWRGPDLTGLWQLFKTHR